MAIGAAIGGFLTSAGGAAALGVAGAAIGARGATRAAETQAASADAALAEQRRSEEAATARLAPFRTTGAQALNPLLEAALDPGDTSFERSQGFEDIQQSAAAGGKLRSGETLGALTEFSAGLNERFRNSRFNRLLQLANLGQTSAAGQANIGVRTGENISSLLVGQGDVRAAGQVGRANAIGTGLNELGSFLGTLRRPPAPIGP